MKNIYTFLIIVIIIIIAIVVMKFVLPKWYERKFQESVNEEMSKIPIQSVIEIIDTNGFLIHVPHDSVVKTMKWQDINSAELINHDSLLVFNMKDKTTRSFKESEYSEWINLIKAVPTYIQTNDRLISFRNEYFSGLLCCKICGKIAVKDSICLSCASKTYERDCSDYSEDYRKNNPNFKTEKQYIKGEQLFWFSGLIEKGKIDFYYKDVLYENCTDWKPSVTVDEVLQYDKESNK
jgi:hypothetical protein